MVRETPGGIALRCMSLRPKEDPQRCYGLTYVTPPGLMGCSLKNNPYASRRGSVRIAHGIAMGILRLRLSLSHGCAVGVFVAVFGNCLVLCLCCFN